jgi:4-amino-4-deoxy-L-arabinose transferase-like glycosyltransferase
MRPPTTWEYSDIAKNLIKNHSFSYKHLNIEYMCFCPPLYTFLVAFVYFFSNFNSLAVIFMQIIIFSLLCAVVFITGKKIFGFKAGFLAAICVMFHPGILFYTLRYEHSLILDSFMMALSTLTMLMLYDKPASLRRLILSGTVLGLSFLSRGTILILLPIFILWIIFVFNQSLKKRLKIAFCFTLISFATILPWTIRNYFVTGEFILVGAVAEECFWLGNNPNASGSSYNVAGQTMRVDLAGEDLLRRVYSSNEIMQKKIFKDAAFDFIKNNPGKFMIFFLKKIYYFWWFSPQFGLLYPKLYIPFYKILYFLEFLFGIVGISLAMKSKNKTIIQSSVLIISVLLSISISQSLFYVEGRHRLALEPLLLIFAANGIFYIKEKIL